MNEFDELILRLKSLKEQKELIEQEIQDIRAEWGDKVMMHGNYQSAVGCIELRKPSQRVSYDNRIVEAVCNALTEISPALAAQLEGARKVSLVAATWAIK